MNANDVKKQHDRAKGIITWTQEHLGKLVLVNAMSLCLQMQSKTHISITFRNSADFSGLELLSDGLSQKVEKCAVV